MSRQKFKGCICGEEEEESTERTNLREELEEEAMDWERGGRDLKKD